MIFLGPVQLGIDAALRNQLQVRATLHNPAALNHTNDIRILNCRQAMGNHNAGASRAGRVQSLLYQL